MGMINSLCLIKSAQIRCWPFLNFMSVYNHKKMTACIKPFFTNTSQMEHNSMTAFYLLSHLQALPSIYYDFEYLFVKQRFSENGLYIIKKGSQTAGIKQC